MAVAHIFQLNILIGINLLAHNTIINRPVQKQIDQRLITVCLNLKKKDAGNN